ncbi:MAG: 30S ribosomal protein S7 [Candidatus Aenigmarchaeota archaeon]|nr:30S ribosomal protein S7 [Candidatus Aenigmarchaeota archaeon]
MRRKVEKVKDVKAAPVAKETRARTQIPVKLFGRWEPSAEVKDPGLKSYVNTDPTLIPRNAGRLRNPFHKSKAHIAERLALHIIVPGHSGKKHKITSGPMGGSFYNALKTVEKAFEIIEKKEGKNPVEILVRAIESAAPREEIITYQMGSIVAREAVVTAPQRRVDKTLRLLCQGTYRRSFRSRMKAAQALAEEIMASYHGKESFAIKERERIEREAAGAR